MIPDWMPRLGSGSHEADSGVACVMEYVSFIKGEEWGDSPKCVEETIANWAVALNDAITDDDLRSRYLVPLLGKIIACTPQPLNEEFWQFVETIDDSLCELPCEMYVGAPEVAVQVTRFEAVLDMFIEYFALTEESVDEAQMQAATAGILAKVL